MSCESCQNDLFPYLYELLEPAERREVEEHLRDCSHCMAELERTRIRSADLASAVKGSFAEVVFKTPAPSKAVRPSRPAIAAARAPRRPLLLNRWAMAAAVLVAVASAGSVIAWTLAQYQQVELDRKQDQVAIAQKTLTELLEVTDKKQGVIQKDIRDIQAEIDKLIGEWNAKDAQQRVEVKNKRVRFEIRGPKSIQPGAPNTYDIQVKPANPGQPVNVTRLEAQVVNDKTKAVLFEKKFAVAGRNLLVLPPDLPIKPGDDLALVLAADADGVPEQVREHLTLLFPEYVTHLSTDRPMYRPGETVRFRSLTLERFNLQPAADDLNLRFRIAGANNNDLFKHDVSTRLMDNDKRVLGPDGQPLRGVGAGEFALPANLPGGMYTLSVSELNDRFPEEKRTFLVHRWQAPRFNKEAEFDRGSYGPGERVVVRGKVSRLADAAGIGGMPGGGGMGGPAGGPGAVFMGNGIALHATVIVDGQRRHDSNQNVDPDGTFSFDFNLPGAMTNGVGTVNLEFQDGGNLETLVRPIPIVLRDVFVDLYPEGGDLVLGVSNRVYFQARTGTSKPADVQGRLFERAFTLDKFGKKQLAKETKEVARFQTLTDVKEPGINQGLGAFTFVPLPNRHYELKLDAPVGIAKVYSVVPPPTGSAYKVKDDGVVLHLPQGVTSADIPVTVQCTGQDRELLVGAYCRGKLLDHTPMLARAGQKNELVLRPAADVGGVYRITVFEKLAAKGETRFVPVAERLMFRKQTAQLQVSIRPDKEVYSPGESAVLSLRAQNEKKEVVPAVAMVAVIDASVVKLANDRTSRSMPTHFLLTTEIRQPEDLENTDALLGDHPRAAQALDLLLGAQGWRRFAEQDLQKFAQKPISPRAKSAGFVLAAQTVPKVGVDEQQVREQFDRPYAGKFVTLEAELAQKEREEAGTPEMQQRLFSAQVSVNQALEQAAEQRSRFDELRGFFVHAGFGALAVGFVVFAFFLVSSGLHRLAEGKRGIVFLSIGLCLLGFLFMASVLGTFAMMGVPEDRMHRFFGRNMGMKMATSRPPMMAMDMKAGDPMMGLEFPQGIDLPQGQDQILDDEEPQGNNVGVPVAVPVVPGGIGQPFNPNLQDRRDRLPEDAERQLRAQGRYQEILQQKLGRRVTVPPPVDASAVREYAHQHKPASGMRRDFAETLCWQPALVLKDGQGQVRFDLSDAVTHFRVLVVSHSLDGRLGADSFEIASRLPYSIEPKVPVQVAASDQITVPVAIANSTKQDTSATLKYTAKGLEGLGKAPGPLMIEAGQTRRQLFHFQPSITEGKAVVRFQGRFDKGSDTVERYFTVVPDGFPAGESFSGTLQANQPMQHEIVMPNDWIDGSLTVQLQAFPSVLGDLQSGLDALLREPHGCFEQASSSNYPNVLILNYLQDTKQANPAVEKQARVLLDSGYHKLLAFECEPGPTDELKIKHGYEWFGKTAPPHEALTAYGLLQFNDMARVYPVDQAMLQRTQKYLLDQRDARGGFKRNARAIDQFGRAPQDVTNAYIVWALAESGVRDDLAVELDALYEQGKTSKDPYFIALTSLGQLKAERVDRGVELLRRLRDFQKDAGEVAGARTSITSSAGRDLLIETTALSALGWLRAAKPGEFHANSQKAGKWLLQQRGGAGSFGSTQSTVLALKALIAFTADNQRATQAGDLELHAINTGQSSQGRLLPTATAPLTVQLKEKTAIGGNLPAVVLEKGKNVIQVQFNGGNTPLPYTLSYSYRTHKPLSADECPVRLTTVLTQPAGKMPATKFKEGQTVKLKAVLENKSGQDQGMAVAVLGLPAGLVLPEDHQQLKDLTRLRENATKPGVISSWDEPDGRELVLYWRELKADAKVEVELDLICRLPGIYTGPASRAYLYYNADHKHWVTPLRASIDAAPALDVNPRQ